MKIWNGYGSEHSMNLVLIGKFKKMQDAERTKDIIKKLSEQALKDDNASLLFHPDPKDFRFSKDMLSLLIDLNLGSFSPDEPGQFLLDYRIERQGEHITVTTDEADISAFVKLFIEAGAKVEIFSAHDYPTDSADAD